MTYENLGSQANAFAELPLALRQSPGLSAVGESLRCWLADSPMLAGTAGTRTQDPLSLRAVPQVHGAVRDAFGQVAEIATANSQALPTTRPLPVRRRHPRCIRKPMPSVPRLALQWTASPSQWRKSQQFPSAASTGW